MVKIRLARYGRKNDPFYRIVAIDSRRKREGMALEFLGTYNPSTKELSVDKKKLDEWTSKGAQISSGVKNILDPKAARKKLSKAQKAKLEEQKQAEAEAAQAQETKTEVESKTSDNADDKTTENSAEATKDKETDSTEADNTTEKQETEENN